MLVRKQDLYYIQVYYTMTFAVYQVDFVNFSFIFHLPIRIFYVRMVVSLYSITL